MRLAFLRKLFEIEQLPPAPSGYQRTKRRTSWVALLLTPEALPQPEARPAARPGGSPGLLRLLFGSEPLPPPPPPERQPARTSLLRLLLAPEDLPPPMAPLPRREGKGLLALLFAPEPLPPGDLAREGPRRRGRWLEWLFAPEKLDKDSK